MMIFPHGKERVPSQLSVVSLVALFMFGEALVFCYIMKCSLLNGSIPLYMQKFTEADLLQYCHPFWICNEEDPWPIPCGTAAWSQRLCSRAHLFTRRMKLILMVTYQLHDCLPAKDFITLFSQLFPQCLSQGDQGWFATATKASLLWQRMWSFLRWMYL